MLLQLAVLAAIGAAGVVSHVLMVRGLLWLYDNRRVSVYVRRRWRVRAPRDGRQGGRMNIDAMLDEIEADAKHALASDRRWGAPEACCEEVVDKAIPRLVAALRYCVFELTGTPGNANDENCEARIARILRGDEAGGGKGA